MENLKDVICYLHSKGALSLLKDSGLTAADLDILTARFVYGWSRFECSCQFFVPGSSIREIEKKAKKAIRGH